MTLGEVKTAELIGPALDWAVAKVGGFEIFKDATLAGEVKPGFWISGLYTDPNLWKHLNTYTPSADWKEGGPLIEKHRISVIENLPAMPDSIWEARGSIGAIGAGWRFAHGPTPLIAAMRCLVASKLGDTVQVPEELLP